MEDPKSRLWDGRMACWPLWTAFAQRGRTAPYQVWWRELNQVRLPHIQHRVQIVSKLLHGPTVELKFHLYFDHLNHCRSVVSLKGLEISNTLKLCCVATPTLH